MFGCISREQSQIFVDLITSYLDEYRWVGGAHMKIYIRKDLRVGRIMLIKHGRKRTRCKLKASDWGLDIPPMLIQQFHILKCLIKFGDRTGFTTDDLIPRYMEFVSKHCDLRLII